MNRHSSHSMQVVKREEKESKLVQFVLSEIAAGRVSLEGCWSAIALSMDSPVVAALRRVVHDLGGASALQIRIVLTACGKHDVGVGFEEIGSLGIRTSQNARFLDAHEQLVIGPVSSWTGDCMRRNPRERDAFEAFGGGGDAELSVWAEKSFWHIWDRSLPLGDASRRDNSVGGSAGIDSLLAGEGTRTEPLVAATSRH